jgi:hypothetical protein
MQPLLRICVRARMYVQNVKLHGYHTKIIMHETLFLSQRLQAWQLRET